VVIDQPITSVGEPRDHESELVRMMQASHRELHQTLSEFMRQQSAMLAKVFDNAGAMMAANASVTAAKIPRPGEIIREVVTEPAGGGGGAAGGADFTELFEMLKPLVLAGGQLIFQKLAGGGAPAAAAAAVETGL
jgi:hypothetical protein